MTLNSKVNVLRWIDVPSTSLQALRRSQGGELGLVATEDHVRVEFTRRGRVPTSGLFTWSLRLIFARCMYSVIQCRNLFGGSEMKKSNTSLMDRPTGGGVGSELDPRIVVRAGSVQHDFVDILLVLSP